VLRAGASGIKRTGEWSVPARMRVKSGMGSVVLDFCETAIAHPVVEIELVLGTGSAKLLVPDDATANVDALVATMGSVRSTVASQPRAGGPAFRRARARVVGLSHRATAPRDRRAAVLGALAALQRPELPAAQPWSQLDRGRRVSAPRRRGHAKGEATRGCCSTRS